MRDFPQPNRTEYYSTSLVHFPAFFVHPIRNFELEDSFLSLFNFNYSYHIQLVFNLGGRLHHHYHPLFYVEDIIFRVPVRVLLCYVGKTMFTLSLNAVMGVWRLDNMTPWNGCTRGRYVSIIKSFSHIFCINSDVISRLSTLVMNWYIRLQSSLYRIANCMICWLEYCSCMYSVRDELNSILFWSAGSLVITDQWGKVLGGHVIGPKYRKKGTLFVGFTENILNRKESSRSLN